MPRKHLFGKSHFGGRTPIFELSVFGLLAAVTIENVWYRIFVELINGFILSLARYTAMDVGQFKGVEI